MKKKSFLIYIFVFSIFFLVGCTTKQLKVENNIQTGLNLTGNILTGNMEFLTGRNITGNILTGQIFTGNTGNNIDTNFNFVIKRVGNKFEIKTDLTNIDPNQKIKKIGVIACYPNFSIQKDKEYFLQNYERPNVLYRVGDRFQNLCSTPYIFNFYTESGEILYSKTVTVENDFFKLAQYHYNILSGIKMERIKNDFFGFWGTDGVKIMGPQSSVYQTPFGGDIKFSATNGLDFLFVKSDGQLFFTDSHGVQRYIYITSKSKNINQKNIGAVISRIAETLTQNKISDSTYRKLMKEKYPTYKKPLDYLKNKRKEGKQKIDIFFYKDENDVYLDGYVVIGLDPKTAESLGYWYIKDNKSVFRGPTKIEGADPETFIVIDGIFSKDKNYVYVENKIFELGEPSMFKKLDIHSQYFLDKNYVYFGGRIVEGADPETFHKAINSQNKKVRLDKNYVYGFGKKIKNSDSKTFEFIDKNHAKDKNNTYKFNGDALYKENK